MPTVPSRRLTIADVMILVPVVAAGTIILRSSLPGFWRLSGIFAGDLPDPGRLLWLWQWLHGVGSCFVVPMMAALVVIRLRQPRPSLRRLGRQPGFVACLAMLSSLVPGGLWVATFYHLPGQTFNVIWTIITYYTDSAVLGSWLALSLAGRWRSEPGWIDRSGRVLGWYWIVMFAWMPAVQAARTIGQLTWRGWWWSS